jgi:uncharacterized membrane protein YqjE
MNENVSSRDSNSLHGSIGELLEKIASDAASLVRAEVSLVKQEIGKKMANLQTGIIMLAAGMVFGLVAFMAFCAAMIIAISTITGPGIATIVIGALLAIIALITAFLGFAQVKKVI